jgi:hypothetical protein
VCLSGDAVVHNETMLLPSELQSRKPCCDGLPNARSPPPARSHLVLLVLLPVRHSPGQLGGAQAVVVQGLALLVEEEVLLAVSADKQDALAGIDAQAAEAAHRGLQHHFRRVWSAGREQAHVASMCMGRVN